MKFFSGFGFKNEQELFDAYIAPGKYTVAGFSYGAQKALKYALETENRIDRLILLSPSFFNDRQESFKRAQIHYFKLDKSSYTKQFMSNTYYPSSKTINVEFMSDTNENELHDLLNFFWKEDDLKSILDKNITIEVFLGGKDKIIDSKAANDFFSKLTTTYFIKEAGHLLDV